MVEVIGRAEDGSTHWDVVPQLQISLNLRQHVLANVGLLIPVNESSRPVNESSRPVNESSRPVNESSRPKQFFLYVLWEWFDGGLLDGW